MKASDYIVEFLIAHGVTDAFGYPGGMLTHLMDSFSHYEDSIKAHVCYNEQGASFEACGYAQASGKLGVAYATSGPGATNLITGICNAYFDSIPVLFITGQVNTFESKKGYKVRQRGFQETDICSLTKKITKFSHYVTDEGDLTQSLEKAYDMAMSGRKGPVLLDVPMDIQRSSIPDDLVSKYVPEEKSKFKRNLICNTSNQIDEIVTLLQKAKRPVIIAGSGIKQSGAEKEIQEFAARTQFPVVTSMLAFDLFENQPNYCGFIGAYGSRTANFIVAKSDLVFAVGTRLDIRQVGKERNQFAPEASIVRVDIDINELSYHIKENEIAICADCREVLNALLNENLPVVTENWEKVYLYIKKRLNGFDDRKPNQLISKLSKVIPDHTVITTDVGQNQVWVAQSFHVKTNQQVLFSGGLGAMGYSLPAAIGAYYGKKKPVVSFCGDGGIQMNIQELAFVEREQLPICLVVLNNHALGMIRHFQEMYFNNNYAQTTEGNGYYSPDFRKIAAAYNIRYQKIITADDIEKELILQEPLFIEIELKEDTYVFPKLQYGAPNQDQEPLLERKTYNELMDL
jgi:acetolactate synthase-1/2/3 large subunit